MNLSREYCKYKIVGVLFIEFRLGGGANILLDICHIFMYIVYFCGFFRVLGLVQIFPFDCN